MENRSELDRGKNGPEMDFRGIFHFFLHFRAIFWPSLPLSSSGRFSIRFSMFSPFLAFRPFSIPYRPDRIPRRDTFLDPFCFLFPAPKLLQRSTKTPCPIWLDNRGTGQWKWLEEVPRRTSLAPLAFPCFVLRLIGLETKNVLDYQGRAGDHFHCTVEPSPGHIRCRKTYFLGGRLDSKHAVSFGEIFLAVQHSLPTLILWSACPSRRPENQKQLKWRKSDSKVTLRGRPQSDSKTTEKWLFQAFWVIFESLWGRLLKVTFESLFRHFNRFWFSGLLEGHALHNINNYVCRTLALEYISKLCYVKNYVRFKFWN